MGTCASCVTSSGLAVLAFCAACGLAGLAAPGLVTVRVFVFVAGAGAGEAIMLAAGACGGERERA